MWQFSKSRSLIFALLLLLSSLTEGIGLVILVPLLGMLQETGAEEVGFVGNIAEGLVLAGIPITLTWLLGVFLVLNIARAIIKYSQSVMSERFRMELLDEVRTKSFDSMLEANWEWLASQKKSDMSNLLINEINRLGTALLFSVRLIVSAFSIAAYLVVAFLLSFGLTLFALLFGAVILIVMRRQHVIAHDQGRLLSDANKQVQQTIEEGLTGLKTIKILRSENHQSKFMTNIRSLLRNQSLKFVRLNASMNFVFQCVIALSMVIFLYSGVEMLNLSLPTLLILILIFSRLAPKLREVQTQFNHILHANAALENYQHLIESTRRVREKTLVQDSIEEIKLEKSIKLTDVSYSYRSRDMRSVSDVSISIQRGKTTAITGASGSGKSTLADLIMGLLAPDSGLIEIDGTPLTESNKLAWRESVAYMPQDVFLFHDTIRSNLLWANSAASTEDIEIALRQASAKFVFDLPQGLDTVVGDAGQQLSGGEKQRIALARAMLKNPQLLILDEATSALDIENETRIRDTIDNLQNALTIIVIGHRLPTLEKADQLIVLDNGQVQLNECQMLFPSVD